MSRISTEQWERRKWYLIRSLFNEGPLLSPIPEAQEQSLEFPSPGKGTRKRDHSPLPELIIEKEPNRHDEPEEYYQALERKIMKFYRKLFRDIDKSSQTSELVTNDNDYLTLDYESYTETVIFTEEIDPPGQLRSIDESESSNGSNHFQDHDSCDSRNNEEPPNFLSAKISTEKEGPSYKDKSNEIPEKTNLTDSRMENSSSSFESQDNDTTIVQAQVHNIRRAEEDNHTHNISESEHRERMNTSLSETQNASGVNIGITDSSGTDIENSDERLETENLDTDFENSISDNEHEASLLSDDDESMLMTPYEIDNRPSVQEPEIMRRQETDNESVESINTINFGRYFSSDFSTDKELKVTSVGEMEAAETTSPELSMSIILGNNSTSKTVRHNEKLKRQNGDRKRPVLAEMSREQCRSPTKQKKFQNLAVQTSFNTFDYERNWQEIQKHFFEGNPRIFKLCSCNNHTCC